MKANKTVLARVLFVVIVSVVSFTASAQLKADFTADQQAGCAPLVVSFTDKSVGSPTSWFWDLGNGVTSTEKKPVTYYFDPGVYTVKLVVQNGKYSDSLVKTSYITVYKSPVAGFSLSDSIGCTPLNVTFTNNSQAGSGSIINTVWDFGDGNKANTFTPSHSYALPGIFSVTLTVSNSYGCTNTAVVKNAVKTIPGVTAGFSFNASTVCHSPGNVLFLQTSTTNGYGLVCQWDFGDGTPLVTGTVPTHNYTKAGDYKVFMRVTPAGGCSDTISKTVHVSFVATAMAIADTFCTNNRRQFVNASTPTPIASYWNFGDSTTDSTTNPYKTYGQTGTYTVKMVSVFFTGCTDSVLKTISVNPGPKASFIVNDSASCSFPFTAHFTNTSAASGLSFVWDFGDGSTATSFNAVHQYAKMGSYTVTLRATNANGCDTVVSKANAVVIKPVQITSVNGFSLPKCIPATVQPALTTNFPVNIQQYHWDFGDGTVSADSSPVHTYTVAGIYTVKVTIQTIGGCSASYSFADSIGLKLHPDFTINPAEVCASDEVTFNNITVGNGTFLWWYPGDGDIIYQQPNPSHQYQDTGWFSPMLVISQYGCYDTLLKTNAVHINGPIARFSIKNNCINKQTVSFANASIEDYTRTWSFGDGTTDTVANPVHVYNTPGIYKASLFVSNGICTFKTIVAVTVVNEKGKMTLDSFVCRNATTNLSISGINNNNIDTTWWHMGNGTTITKPNGTNSVYSYHTNGKYTVYAVVKDILNCLDTLQQPYKVSVTGPFAKLKAMVNGACKNGLVNFSDTSLSDGVHPITGWIFDFGDSNLVKYTNDGPFAHTYNKTGLFTTKMTVTDNAGCSDSALSNPINITQPVASFKVSDSVVCPGKQVTFNNTSAGQGIKFNWNFGDGVKSTATNPAHLYGAQGIYIPRLYVTDVNNCVDSAVLVTGVSMNKPVAKFTMSDSFSTCPPLSVKFENQSAFYQTFQWNFGDTNTSSLQSPEHVYTYPGKYTARLLLVGDGGCTDTAVKTITIQGPTGKLNYNKTQACYPFTQKITAAAQNAVQYLWDYGDGNTLTSTKDTSSHIYQPGFYIPKLILISAAGCKVPIKGLDTIKVYGIKTMGLADTYLLCDSGNVNFKDTSITNDAIKLSYWAFGDNTFGYGNTLAHNYAASGTYAVKLVDVTVNGCTDTLNLPTPVKVAKRPMINIAGATSFCLPAPVLLQATLAKADTSTLSWKWYFGNGDSSFSQNPPAIVYSGAGNYQVHVSAINSSGCAGTATTAIAMHALPQVNAGNDTSVCRNTLVKLVATGATSYTWGNMPGLSCAACSSPLVIADSTTLYTVTGKDQFGCIASDSVIVNVTQPVKITVTNSDTLCSGNTKKLVATGAKTYKWMPSTFLSDDATAQPTFFASKDTAITYSVIGYGENQCFSDTATVKVKVYPVPEMQVVQTNIDASVGNPVQLRTINSPDVTKWKWTPAMWLDNPNSANPTAQPRESITYTVVAANDGACVTRAQVAVTVTCSGANIFVPNTFSPNGDNMNDVFYARGTGLYNIKSFRIFNRWGQLVFERLNVAANNLTDGWNGTINGQPAPNDVYVYVIEVVCINNTIIPVKGNVTLIR